MTQFVDFTVSIESQGTSYFVHASNITGPTRSVETTLPFDADATMLIRKLVEHDGKQVAGTEMGARAQSSCSAATSEF